MLTYVIIAFWVALQPLASDALWWDLSRGREVLAGSISPSRSLLELDQQAESDWLGGVLGFIAYALLGSSGLMLFRVAFVSSVAAILWLSVRGAMTATNFLFASLTLLCLLPAANSVSLVYDVIGVTMTLWFANRWFDDAQPRFVVTLAVVCGLWANFGACYAIFLPIVISVAIGRFSKSSVSGRSFAIGMTALIACAVLNPRAGLGMVDSIRRMIVVGDIDSAHRGTDGMLHTWLGLSPEYGVVIPVAFVGISVLALWRQFRLLGHSPSRFWQIASVGLVCQYIVWTSQANLSMAAVWIAMTCVSVGWPVNRSSDKRFPAAQHLQILGCCLLLIGVVAIYAPNRLGWGIDAAQDPRYLQNALPEDLPPGTAWADSLRSAGLLAWIHPAGIRLQDVPHRAMLGGRLRRHEDIRHDLVGQRKTSYYRGDGSQGGWWLSLQDRQTEMLLVASTNVELIRGLEPTLWKPLTLDSPVLAYASTGNAAYSKKILEILQQRHFVDRGVWAFQRPQSTGSAFDRDRCGLAQDVGSIEQSVRQASVFASMDCPHAAMRVLQYEQTHHGARLSDQIAHCQMQMLHREYAVASRCSQMRALATTIACQRAGLKVAPAFPMPDLTESSSSLRKTVQLYLSGRWTEAISELSAIEPSEEDRYGLAMILLEAGRIDEGQELLQGLAVTTKSTMRLLVIEALASLEFNLSSS